MHTVYKIVSLILFLEILLNMKQHAAYLTSHFGTSESMFKHLSLVLFLPAISVVFCKLGTSRSRYWFLLLLKMYVNTGTVKQFFSA